MTVSSRRARRVCVAVALALVLDGWLLMSQATGPARWAGLAVAACAVPVLLLAGRPGSGRGRVGSAGRGVPDPAAAGRRLAALVGTGDTTAAATPAPTRPVRPALLTAGTAALIVLTGTAAVAVVLAAAPFAHVVTGPWRPAAAGDLADRVASAAVGLDVLVLVLAVAATAAGLLALRARRSADRGAPAPAGRTAEAAAGRLVGDMLAAADGLLAPAVAGRTWRERGHRAVADLQDLARGIDSARTGADADDLAALRRHWDRVVARTDAAAWSRLDALWSIMEGDVRTRLVAAGRWLAPETARRVGTLVRDPRESAPHPRLVGDADPGAIVRGGETTAVLDASRHHVDRLLVLVVQLLDLGEVYEPPQPVGGPAGTARGAVLGGPSAVGIDITLSPAVASAVG